MTEFDDSENEDKLSADLLRQRLLGLVEQILASNSITRKITIDEPLTAAGLASIDMIKLMLAVEAEFDIAIPASEITVENFRSVSTIEALVANLSPRMSGKKSILAS